MAYTFSTGNTPATGATAMWLLISTLVVAGWVVKSDSDGTTYAPAGGQVTGGGVGAHGLNNANAWIRIQAPATNGGAVVNQHREFTFQRGNNSTAWRIKYSASANFLLGLPSAAATPASADEVFMIGSGTDAAPGFSNFWFAADGSYRWHIAAGGAAESYSFYAFSLTSTTKNTSSGLLLDVMKAGSYSHLDVDPAVVFVSDRDGSGLSFGVGAIFCVLGITGLGTQTNPAISRAWFGPTSGQGAAITPNTNSQMVGLVPHGNAGAPILGGSASMAVNPWTAKDDMLPARWMRPSNNSPPFGYKGTSTLFCYGSMLRATMDTADTVGAKDMVFIAGQAGAATQCLWMPWDGSVPVL